MGLRMGLAQMRHEPRAIVIRHTEIALFKTHEEIGNES